MDRNWRERARCLKYDPELFHPHGNSPQGAAARRICREECPVLIECQESTLALEATLPRSEIQGVAGGLSATERRKLLGYVVTPTQTRRTTTGYGRKRGYTITRSADSESAFDLIA